MSTTISGTNGVTFPDSTSMQTGQQACKAWVNFDGTGTVAIRDGYNVSSITDNAIGDYTVNFTTAMPDANYATVVSSGRNGTGTGGYLTLPSDASAQTASSVQIYTIMVSGGTADTPIVFATIFSN